MTYHRGEMQANDLVLLRNLGESPDLRFKIVILRGLASWLTSADGDTQAKYFSAVTSQDAAVQRESLLLLAGCKVDGVSISTFYAACKLYDGQDISYRAALNIACGTDPVRRDKILADFEKHFPEWNDKVADLVWELRPKSMLPKMEQLMGDAKITVTQKGRIVDILAASDDVSAGKSMLNLLKGDQPAEVKARALDNLKLFLPTKWSGLANTKDLGQAITEMLADGKSRTAGLQLVGIAKFNAGRAEVVAIATDVKQDTATRSEAIHTLGQLPSAESFTALRTLLENDGAKELNGEICRAIAALAGKSQGQVQKDAVDALSAVVLAKTSSEVSRTVAIEGLAGSRVGTQWLMAIQERGGLPVAVTPLVGRLLRNSPFQDLRNKAMLLFPAAGKLDPKKLPPIVELAKRVGNADNGKLVMAKSLTSEVQCMKCHMVRGQGGSIGPDLSMIGKKASKENLYESLFTPSKAIADQYVSWKVDAEDGQSVTGLLVEETETTLTIRDANGKDYQFPLKGSEKKKQLTSIMPEGLVATLTEEELVDVVEYLTKLQTASLTPDVWQVMGPLSGGLDGEIATVPSKMIRPLPSGYVDLASFHGEKGKNSFSVMTRTIECPVDQEATILLGTDDGCRLFVNGIKVFGHDRTEAAVPERDSVTVKLKKGANAIVLKVSNGDNPHGFYFTIMSGQELKLSK